MVVNEPTTVHPVQVIARAAIKPIGIEVLPTKIWPDCQKHPIAAINPPKATATASTKPVRTKRIKELTPTVWTA